MYLLLKVSQTERMGKFQILSPLNIAAISLLSKVQVSAFSNNLLATGEYFQNRYVIINMWRFSGYVRCKKIKQVTFHDKICSQLIIHSFIVVVISEDLLTAPQGTDPPNFHTRGVTGNWRQWVFRINEPGEVQQAHDFI